MSVRPRDNNQAPTPEVLKEWPDPPSSFDEAECEAWRMLGFALVKLGTASACDLIHAVTTARVMARVDRCFTGPPELMKMTAVTSLINLQTKMLQQLGLTPTSRRGVAPLPEGKDEGKPDPVGEFANDK